jgi:hypothetical protein
MSTLPKLTFPNSQPGSSADALIARAKHINPVIDQVNTNTAALAAIADFSAYIIDKVVGTSTSTTVDWTGILEVGDLILQLGTAGTGTVTSMVCGTIGTLPEATVISDIYLVIRAA